MQRDACCTECGVVFHDLELSSHFLDLLVYVQDRNGDSRDFNTTNSRITRVAKRTWAVGALVGTMSGAIGVAVGTLIGGTVPFDVTLEGAAVAFIAFVMGAELVFGIPDSGDFVVVG